MLRITKTYIIFFICLLWVGVFRNAPMAEAEETYFRIVSKMLLNDGFDQKYIQKVFQNPKARLDLYGVSLFFIHKESRIDYDQFASEHFIINAKEYIEKHKRIFQSSLQEYGVNAEVITAIMVIETGLGTNMGNRSVFNTLATLISLNSSEVREMLWKKASKNGDLSRDQFEEKVIIKSDWAYNELKSFLLYTRREGIDPLKISGSYAGAMGIPQFISSKAFTLGVDGNNDGHVDLFNHDDAIMSVANYLKFFGWYKEITDEEAYQVIYQYNRSKYYVNAVLKIARILKG